MKKVSDKGLFISIGDLFFWAGILCELAVSFSGYLFGGYKEQIIIVLGMCMFSLKIVMDIDIKKEGPAFLVLAAYGLLAYMFQGSALILRIILILFAGRDQDAKKVMKLFLYVTLVVMVITGILSGMGLFRYFYLQEEFRHTPDEIRYTFGFIHPNGFTFFAFRVLLLAVYVYFDRLKWWGLLILWGAYIPFVYLADSKSGMALGTFLIVLALIAKINFSKTVLKVLYWTGNIVMAAEIIFAYVSMVCYDPHFGPDGYAVGFWQTINQYVVTGRLTSAFNTFHEYPITLMGMYKAPFTTEIGFVSSLYAYGAVFVIFYYILLFSLFYRVYKQGNKIGMVFVVIMNLYAFSEDFLPYVNKNMILMLGIGLLFTGLNMSAFKKLLSKNNDSCAGSKSGRKKVRVLFTDFWPGFNPEDNYFTNILKKYYDVEICDNPDYVICSSFGNSHVKYMNAVKIMFTGENINVDFNMFDYAIGFNNITYGDRYLRLPLYALYTDVIEKVKERGGRTKEYYLNKSKFGCYVISNMDSAPERKMIVDEIDKYKKLDSGGRYKNNVGGPVKDKLAFTENYRFSLALENSSSDGYVTEKILEAFAAGTIPVYWGTPDVKKDFNPQAFIYAGDYKDSTDLVDHIREIEENQDKYLAMATAPVLNENSLAGEYFKEEYAHGFLQNIFEQPIDKAYRRNMEYFGRNYQLKMMELQRISDIADIVRKPVHYISKKVNQICSGVRK